MALILLNLVVWIVIQSVGSMPAMGQSLCLYGLIPADLLGKVVPGSQIPIAPGLACVLDGKSEPFTLLSSMFLHGGWFHLIGNMWFLWVFGDNIEDAMGSMRFLLFYLVCGFVAGLALALPLASSENLEAQRRARRQIKARHRW